MGAASFVEYVAVRFQRSPGIVKKNNSKSLYRVFNYLLFFHSSFNGVLMAQNEAGD